VVAGRAVLRVAVIPPGLHGVWGGGGGGGVELEDERFLAPGRLEALTGLCRVGDSGAAGSQTCGEMSGGGGAGKSPTYEEMSGYGGVDKSPTYEEMDGGGGAGKSLIFEVRQSCSRMGGPAQ
jgi:hypothetical protein